MEDYRDGEVEDGCARDSALQFVGRRGSLRGRGWRDGIYRTELVVWEA